jgi:hypothetical protein
MQNFLVANGRPTNVQIQFNGGPGTASDAMTIVNTTRRNARYFADTVDTIKSGDINITDTYVGTITAAQQSAMRVSFASLTPIDFQARAGGTLAIDTTNLLSARMPGMTDRLLVQDDQTPGDGANQITSDNPFFETTFFRGFEQLETFGGAALAQGRLDSKSALLLSPTLLTPLTSAGQVPLDALAPFLNSSASVTTTQPVADPSAPEGVKPVVPSVPSLPLTLADVYVMDRSQISTRTTNKVSPADPWANPLTSI